MFPRALTLGLLAVLAGCSAGTDAGAASLDSGEQVAETRVLVFEGDAQLGLLPNETRDLVVSYVDTATSPPTPLPGVQVEFRLTGSAPGASLSPPQAITDENGVARTVLRAGGSTSDLMVRARAEAAVQTLSVAVSEALGVELEVAVAYAGLRDVASFTVTALPNMTCEQALKAGLAGDTSFTFVDDREVVSFSLGYGLEVAIFGWGRDARGGKLAHGCQMYRAPTTDDVAAARGDFVLALEDVALRLPEQLPLELELNVASAGSALIAASERAVAGAIMPDGAYAMFADADYLLNAVASALAAQNDGGGASELAARRASQALAATLQPALMAAESGPTAYGSVTGAALARRGASLVARWSLGSSSLSSLSARSADGSDAQVLDMLPAASLGARFSEDTAELSFDPLRIELGLGSYGRALLAGFDAETQQARARAGGCAAFAAWWTGSALTDIAPASDAEAACDDALAALDDAIALELGSLDAEAAALLLRGDVAVHDREDQGPIEDVGPGALQGSWGERAVNGELRVPARTAFE